MWSEANDDGTRTIHACLTPEVAALVESALETARRLACDARLTVSVEERGKTIDSVVGPV